MSAPTSDDSMSGSALSSGSVLPRTAQGVVVGTVVADAVVAGAVVLVSAVALVAGPVVVGSVGSVVLGSVLLGSVLLSSDAELEQAVNSTSAVRMASWFLMGT